MRQDDPSITPQEMMRRLALLWKVYTLEEKQPYLAPVRPVDPPHPHHVSEVDEVCPVTIEDRTSGADLKSVSHHSDPPSKEHETACRHERSATTDYGTHVIAIDIETTGLPSRKGFNAYYDPSRYDMYDSSRVVSVALYSRQFQKYAVIRPTDFTIRNSQFHGITQEKAVGEGIPLRDFFDADTVNTLKKYQVLVAHNMNFDMNVLKSEMLRQGLGIDIFPQEQCCTMIRGKNFLRHHKWPTLETLYNTLFENTYAIQHHALDDARVAYECYHKMNENPLKM